MIRVGLNPYGIAYANGLMAQDTARANPRPNTLEQYIEVARRVGGQGIEMDVRQLAGLDDAGLARLGERFREMGYFVVLSLCPPIAEGIGRAVACARRLGVKVIRMHLTPILCGDRSAAECDWPGTVAAARRTLTEAAKRAGEYGLAVAVENHQDFTSRDLLDFCGTCGANVGITLDTGNPFSVAEDPVEFARAIAPKCKHVHLKDYRVQQTDEGYRLVRCPIGDGAVPFLPVIQALKPAGELTACIEPGALSVRHVRCFTREWWRQYPVRSAEQFAQTLRAARVNRLAEEADYRTPWESDGSAEEIVRFEMDQLWKSVENLRGMGLLPARR